MQAEIYNVDYAQFTHILGTTHFSKRSLYEAYKAVNQLEPTDLAIELDMQRYDILNSDCATCPQNHSCTRKCEFIGAVEALGNRDTNIWLIDMSRREFWQRMRRLPAKSSHWRVLLHERDTLMAARLAWLTTEGLKSETTPRILALVGAAHVKRIISMLRNPIRIKENLSLFQLQFTPPKLIRRVAIVDAG